MKNSGENHEIIVDPVTTTDSDTEHCNTIINNNSQGSKALQDKAEIQKDSAAKGNKIQLRRQSKSRKYHKWLAVIISVFLLLFAFSGIILNHRSFFSVVDIDRRFLPEEYRYDNWNLASVRSSLQISADSVLVYGNMGIWLTDSIFSSFDKFGSGFPTGIDNRRIFTIFKTQNGHVFAGSMSGLYILDRKSGSWVRTILPVNETRVTGITQKADSVFIMTRSNLLVAADTGKPVFEKIRLPPAEDDDGTESLFRTLWVIHSGKIYGLAGKLVVDLMALVLIFLVISGYIYWFTPGVIKRLRTSRIKSRIKRTNRFMIKWHNTLGWMSVAFLVVITLTGMFLRPPLLIPVAGSRMPVIKGSWLDNPNPWFDKLRDIIWDDESGVFLYATSEGIYYSEALPVNNLKRFVTQPPVSVMGVNVFEKSGNGEYLVGSFSGIYRWHPASGKVVDHLTNQSIATGNGLSSPFGSFAVAGRLLYQCGEILFDYTQGAIATDNNLSFPEMPPSIIENSPMSLWNLALEVHTGRYLFPLIGNLYILYIPIVGISTIIVLVTGLIIWWRKRR